MESGIEGLAFLSGNAYLRLDALMSSGSPNPYATPQASPDQPDPPEDSGWRSPLPPITPVRLFLAFTLISVAWIAVWAQSREIIGSAWMIPVVPMVFSLMGKVTNPHSQRRDDNFKWYHMALVIPFFVVFMVFLWTDVPFLPLMKAALIHPAACVLGWMISCVILINDWKKRRNNPPYLSKPHAELPSESPWKALPRQ